MPRGGSCLCHWPLPCCFRLIRLASCSPANTGQFIRADPPSTQIGKFLGVTPGYGERLGLADDWAYNLIKEVGNYAEIYERNVGGPYSVPRAMNNLYTNGGVFFPLMVD